MEHVGYGAWNMEHGTCWARTIMPSEVHVRYLGKASQDKHKPKFLNGQQNGHNGMHACMHVCMYVLNTFHNRMVFMICIMGMWILNKGQVMQTQGDLSIECKTIGVFNIFLCLSSIFFFGGFFGNILEIFQSSKKKTESALYIYIYIYIIYLFILILQGLPNWVWIVCLLSWLAKGTGME